MATLLWDDANDETLLDNLRACVWKLRKALGDTEHRVVASDSDDIVLDVAAFDVDALAFRRLAAQSGRGELEAAAALYTGEFLDGLVIESEEFETWRRGEASRYQDQAIDVLSQLMALFSECGEPERAIEAGERVLRLEPLHEAALRWLMRHYGESGRRGAAIQLYRTFTDALRTELDVQPEAETRAIFMEIARGSEDRTNDPVASDAKLPRHSTSMARPSDAPGGVLRPSARTAFRLRAPLAILAGALIVAAALMSYRQFMPLGAQPGVVAERAAAADPSSAISIAVLPFLYLSGDAGQEFFADGMTEEITSALAMVPDLKVVARTSAFQFKGEKNDMRAIGRALNATHLIEGSVRKEGNRVRITAQLIEADSGVHVWTESYDRELTGVFAVQEEIATAIAGSLRVPLGLRPGENLVSLRPKDEETYELFLRGRAAVRARRAEEAISFLDQVVARDPNFASGWRFLAAARNQINIQRNQEGQEPRRYPESQETLARRVIALAPGSAEGYAMLANLAAEERKSLEALAFLEQALARIPTTPRS